MGHDHDNLGRVRYRRKVAEVAVQLESGCHGLNSKDEETETAGTGGEYTDMPGLSCRHLNKWKHTQIPDPFLLKLHVQV